MRELKADCLFPKKARETDGVVFHAQQRYLQRDLAPESPVALLTSTPAASKRLHGSDRVGDATRARHVPRDRRAGNDAGCRPVTEDED